VVSREKLRNSRRVGNLPRPVLHLVASR
jgi:hypothetical protein